MSKGKKIKKFFLHDVKNYFKNKIFTSPKRSCFLPCKNNM